MTRADPRWLALLLAAALLLTVAASLAAQPDCRTIEDFSKVKVGELPADWKLRKDSGKEVYRVAEESGLRFLHATAKGLGVQVAKCSFGFGPALPLCRWRRGQTTFQIALFPIGGYVTMARGAGGDSPQVLARRRLFPKVGG